MPNKSNNAPKEPAKLIASRVYAKIEQPIVFVDVETTGTSARFGNVIELGAIRVENGGIVGEMNTLIDPGMPLSTFTTSLTGITDEDMQGAPTFRSAADSFVQLASGAVFAAHNVYFDFGFLRAELERVGVVFAPKLLCTVQLSRALYPSERRHNLATLIERHGLLVKRRHRAYDDAKALLGFVDAAVHDRGEAAVVRAMQQQLKSPALPTPRHRSGHLVNRLA